MVASENAVIPVELLHNHDQVEMAWRRIGFVHSMFHDPSLTKKALLIYGESGLGKSYLLETYKQQYPGQDTGELVTIPVLYYAFHHQKKSPDEVLKLLITQLGAPQPRGRTNSAELETQFIHLLREKRVELIVLDEIQNLITSYDGVQFQGIIKYFCWMLDCAEIKCSIVFAGSHLAKRILNFGSEGKKLDDVEHLSRRTLRPINLRPIKPKTIAWLDCVNWFMAQLDHAALTIEEDKYLLDRIYIAYQTSFMSTLRDIFLRSNCRKATSKSALVACLEENYDMHCQGKVNPFDTHLLSDEQAHHYTQKLRERTKLEQLGEMNKALAEFEVVY